MSKVDIKVFSDLMGTFSRHRFIDDSFDRGHRLYAPIILILTSSLFGIMHFYGDPIECTQTLTDAKASMKYVKSFCWSHGAHRVDDDHLLSYYQWVPFILLVQAIMLQLPHAFWLQRASGSGINLPTIMDGASKLTEVYKTTKKREGLTVELAHVLHAFFRRNIEGMGPLKSWKKMTIYNLTLCYFSMKIFYVISIVLQMILLNGIFDHQFLVNFHEVMNELTFRKNATQSKIFPLLGICKFHNNIKVLEEKKHLCTLPLNMFNSKVFAIDCLILIFLVLGMVTSILLWAARMFIPSLRDDLVKKVLLQNHHRDEVRRLDVERFETVYLRHDGVFILKLIRLNLGVNTSREITRNLYDCYREISRKVPIELNVKSKFGMKIFISEDDVDAAEEVAASKAGASGGAAAAVKKKVSDWLALPDSPPSYGAAVVKRRHLERLKTGKAPSRVSSL